MISDWNRRWLQQHIGWRPRRFCICRYFYVCSLTILLVTPVLQALFAAHMQLSATAMCFASQWEQQLPEDALPPSGCIELSAVFGISQLMVVLSGTFMRECASSYSDLLHSP